MDGTSLIIMAPVIMMSQNRQEERDRLRAELGYEVNLQAELEIEQLYAKMDGLCEQQWQGLLQLQKHQIELLQGLVDRTHEPGRQPAES